MGLINFFKKLFTTEKNVVSSTNSYKDLIESPEVFKNEVTKTSEILDIKIEETKVEEPKIVSENKPKKRRYYPKKKKSASSGEPNTSKKNGPKKKGPSKA